MGRFVPPEDGARSAEPHHQEEPVQIDPDEMTDVVHRLRRAQGQIGGVLRMIDDGADCIDVVTQLSAASKALDRAGYAVIATSLEKCLALGEQADIDRERLHKAFLSLA